MRHLIDELFHRLVVLQILELDRHGRGRHGRLLGRYCEVHELNQHKAQRVIDPCCHPGPEG